MSEAIALDNVALRIGRATLVDSVNLRIAPGEFVALAGPNGAGKSSLLRLISGELSASQGTVLLRGRPVGSYDAATLATKRTVVAQSVQIPFLFSAEEVVRMAAPRASLAGLDAIIDDAIRTADIEAVRDRPVATLSGGEQQRVHFARALVQLGLAERAQGPGILLLDEPTASLDLRHQIALLSVARMLSANGTTVIAVLHDLNLATVFARRIVLLCRGRIAADGPPRAVVNEENLRSVFGVAGAVDRVPSADMPFVLPHAMSEQH